MFNDVTAWGIPQDLCGRTKHRDALRHFCIICTVLLQFRLNISYVLAKKYFGLGCKRFDPSHIVFFSGAFWNAFTRKNNQQIFETIILPLLFLLLLLLQL